MDGSDLKPSGADIKDLEKTVSGMEIGPAVSAKDNARAQILQGEGDAFFQEKFYIDAIDKYNECLSFAEADEKEPFKLNEIYMKRAFALLRMDLHEECLVSTRLAEAGDYPERLREKLTKIKKQCEEQLKNVRKTLPKYRLKLTHPSNKKIPFIADCLKLHTDEKYGRHIVTNQELKVGDVVMIERPILSFLFKDMQHQRCSNCTAGDKRHALIPCPTCTGVLYCSEDRLNEAWNAHHKYECKISDIIQSEDVFAMFAMRTLFVGIATFGGLEQLKQFLEENKDNDTNAFDLDYNERDRKLEFLVLHNLRSVGDHLPIGNRKLYKRRAHKLAKLLVDKQVLGGNIADAQLKFLQESIYRYHISTTLNSFRTSTIFPPHDQKRIPAFVSQLGAMAMINHSCAQNVMRFQQADNQVLVISRPIKKGGQLFDTYGKGYWANPKRERQLYYMEQYGFECTCEACEKDFPQRQKIRGHPQVPFIHDIDYYVAKFGNGQSAHLEFVESLQTLMQKYDRFFPCLQLHDADAEWETEIRQLLDCDFWEQDKQLMRYKKKPQGDSDCTIM